MPAPTRSARIFRWALVGCAAISAIRCSGKDGTATDPVDDDSDPTTPTIAPPDTAGLHSGGDTAGTGPLFDCYANVSIDEDSDGTTDGSGYDGWDAANPTFLLYTERDYNGNGMPESFASWVRDDAGRVLRYQTWGTSTGAYDATYDEDGNRLTYDEDSDGDGDVDLSSTYTYEAGALVRHERDDGADGLVDYVLTYVRDEYGRRVSAEEDSDGDGLVDVTYAYTIDDQGRETLIETDTGADGVVDRTVVFTYTDPTLRVGTSAVDDGVDGVFEQNSGFAYDENNRETYYALDIAPVDGVFDYERWSDRNELGSILNYRLVTSLYGDPLEVVQDFEYDGLNRQIELHTVVTNLAAGTVDDDITYTYLFGGTCPSP